MSRAKVMYSKAIHSSTGDKLAVNETPSPSYEATRVYGQSMGMRLKSREKLIDYIRKGFKIETVQTLSNNLGLPEKELIQHASISARTFVRRKEEGHLHADESDRIARIGLLFDEVMELFAGDKEKTAYWIKSNKKALAGATPLEYIDTEVGFQEVKELIGRIKHGVFS